MNERTARPPDDGGVDSLGGYRLVRRLGVGTRSEVWLGSDGAATAAIKVFREGVSSECVNAEIEALGRSSHRHLVRLEDLAMAPNGIPCMILQRLSQWSLGSVLAAGRPSDGEAVTILAPLCLAVAELHRVGVAHGRIGAGSIFFDTSGAPVLASFGKAELFGPMPYDPKISSVSPAQLNSDVSVSTDTEALTKLCTFLLRPDSETARWLTESKDRDNSTFARELAERIFRHAASTPLHTVMPSWSETAAPIPSRVNETAVLSHERVLAGTALSHAGADKYSSADATASGAGAARFSAITHIPLGLVNTVTEWWSTAAERGPASMVAHRIRDALRPIRKSVWIFSGVVMVCVVAFVTMMPSGDSADSSSAMTVAVPSPTSEPLSSAGHTVITQDDPVAAAAVLLDARAECFAALSVLCLDSVNQRGSAVMEADVDAVRLLQEGGANDGAQPISSTVADGISESRQIVLVERLGDSALLSLSFRSNEVTDANFSVLLFKLEEGWRLRDLTPVFGSPHSAG